MFNPFKKKTSAPADDDQKKPAEVGSISAPEKEEEPQYKNFEEYARDRLAKRNLAISENFLNRYGRVLQNPRNVLDFIDSVRTRAEFDEEMRQAKLKNFATGEWGVVFNKFILPKITQERDEREAAESRAAQNTEKKLSNSELNEKIMAFADIVNTGMVRPMTENSLRDAKVNLNQAREWFCLYPGREEEIGVIINRLEEYLSEIISFGNKIKVINSKKNIEEIMADYRKELKDIYDRIAEHRYDYADQTLLDQYKKELEKITENKEHLFQKNQDYQKIIKMIKEAKGMISQDFNKRTAGEGLGRKEADRKAG